MVFILVIFFKDISLEAGELFTEQIYRRLTASTTYHLL